MDPTTAQIVVDILKHAVPLSADQIWIYNQRKEIPPTRGFFVVVGYVSSKPYGASRKQVADSSGLVEKCSVVMQEMLSIKVTSADYSTVQQLPMIIAALSSTYAREMQEKWGFKLATVPLSVPETSELEGSGILYQFTITVNALRGYTKEGNIDYYDQFSTETSSEKGIV